MTKTTQLLSLFTLGAAICVSPLGWAEPVRMAVIITNNHGQPSEEPLRFANAEGLRVVQTLLDVGGMEPEHIEHVANASVDSIAAALGRAVVRASALEADGQDVVLFVYYTGHAGFDGLHLGSEIMSYSELKAAARVVPAQQRVFTVDACQSGGMLRTKGARLVTLTDGPEAFTPPPDEAWLTSTGPEEQAFEVDRRRGALFTHFFVSGVRGAADINGDLRVTLSELFHFVESQTTEAAAVLGQQQNPSWAGELGDLVIGDLHEVPAALQIEGPVANPILVVRRDTEQVEAEIPAGSHGYLALPPGNYQLIALSDAPGSLVGSVHLEPGEVESISVGERLTQVQGVRTKGGLIVERPWLLAAGYALGIGATPGRVDGHGVFIHLDRALGKGNNIGATLDVMGNQFATSLREGTNTRINLGVGWTHDVQWRRVQFGPGLQLHGGWLRQNTVRIDDPVWGSWWGENPDQDIEDFAILGGNIVGVLHLPLGPLRLRFAAHGGFQVVLLEQARAFPTGGIELGFGVAL